MVKTVTIQIENFGSDFRLSHDWFDCGDWIENKESKLPHKITKFKEGKTELKFEAKSIFTGVAGTVVFAGSKYLSVAFSNFMTSEHTFTARLTNARCDTKELFNVAPGVKDAKSKRFTAPSLIWEVAEVADDMKVQLFVFPTPASEEQNQALFESATPCPSLEAKVTTGAVSSSVDC